MCYSTFEQKQNKCNLKIELFCITAVSILDENVLNFHENVKNATQNQLMVLTIGLI